MALTPRRLACILATLLLATCAAVGCSRPKLVLGDPCSLNSDCDEEFYVCRYDRCRQECFEDRDCAAGLDCYFGPERGVDSDPPPDGGTRGPGVCQLPEEKFCEDDDDCGVLACVKMADEESGNCEPLCTTDLDCGPRRICDVVEGRRACVGPGQEPCIYNSDCPDPTHVCHPDQTCGPECREDRDCPHPRVCRDAFCELP